MNVIASFEAGDARSLLFHGTADGLTPYSAAQTTSQRSGAVGVPSYLITWEGAGHVPYVANRTQIHELTTNFLYSVLDLATSRLDEPDESGAPRSSPSRPLRMRRPTWTSSRTCSSAVTAGRP